MPLFSWEAELRCVQIKDDPSLFDFTVMVLGIKTINIGKNIFNYTLMKTSNHHLSWTNTVCSILICSVVFEWYECLIIYNI